MNNESNSEIDESMLLISNKIIPIRFQRFNQSNQNDNILIKDDNLNSNDISNAPLIQ